MERISAMYWLNNLIGKHSDYYDKALEMGIKALKQQEELQRARILLKATHDLLKAAKRNPYVENVLSMLVYYDEENCDGYCLMEDIENYFDEFDANVMRTEETDYEKAVEQLEHDILYEPTFNQDDGSM